MADPDAMAHSPPHKKAKLAETAPNDLAPQAAAVPTKLDPFKVMTNRTATVFSPKFLTFYKEQGFFETEEEWNQFLEALQTDLPTTFRITGIGAWTDIIRETFMDLFVRNKDASKLEINSETEIDIEPPRPLTWYPNNLGWHFSPPKKILRASTMLKHVKHFLNIESDIGNLSRQEAVSMVPPLMLDVESHHRVLDMCAAPGSKTCQLIEMLHANTLYPTGIVVANDVDIARCYMLSHITARLGSQALLITNYEAQKFPFVRLPSEKAGEPERLLKFDRVLCDVPCSGDGTIRKQPDVAKFWTPKIGEQLHILQLQIAWRGIQLLEVGGTMVYSTCAFNPIEDEAVVAHLLRVAGGALELVDVSHKLPSLARRPGLKSWKMMDEGAMIAAKSIEDIADPQRRHCVTRSMFPPSVEENERFHLERCVRLFPHLQDTGGFFVAVLRKVGDIDLNTRISPSSNVPVPVTETPADAVAAAPVASSGEDENVNKLLAAVTSTEAQQKAQRAKGGRISTFKEEPYFPLDVKSREELLKLATDFYGLDRSSGLFENLVTRYQGNPDSALPDRLNKVYLLNDYAFSIVAHGTDGASTSTGKLRILSAGLRIFENDSKRNKKVNLKCPFRLQPESLQLVLPHVSKRIIPISRDDFLFFLRTKEPPMFESYSPDARTALEADEELGCCVLVVDPARNPSKETESAREKLLFGHQINIVAWRGRSSCALWIDKLELKSLDNLYLSERYDVGFDPTPRRPDPEKRERGIAERAKLKEQREKEAEAKKAAAGAAAPASSTEAMS